MWNLGRDKIQMYKMESKLQNMVLGVGALLWGPPLAPAVELGRATKPVTASLILDQDI